MKAENTGVDDMKSLIIQSMVQHCVIGKYLACLIAFSFAAIGCLEDSWTLVIYSILFAVLASLFDLLSIQLKDQLKEI